MMESFTSTLSPLSSMITPTVLILASGQLIMTTSQRLARAMERARKLAELLEELTEKEPENIEKREYLYSLLRRSARRGRRLQKSMSILYIALSLFVCTSVSIGLLDIFDVRIDWLPLILGFLGIGLMFYATIHLIIESRIAVGTVNKELAYLTGRKHYKLN